jgi:hypothetical protein
MVLNCGTGANKTHSHLRSDQSASGLFAAMSVSREWSVSFGPARLARPSLLKRVPDREGIM